MEKRLGKIKKVYFGLGGYQGTMIGLHMTFESAGWGVCWSVGATLDPETIECSSYCKWTELDRDKSLVECLRELSKLFKAAKVDRVDRLAGVPVEVEFDGMTMKGFRILEEVL